MSLRPGVRLQWISKDVLNDRNIELKLSVRVVRYDRTCV